VLFRDSVMPIAEFQLLTSRRLLWKLVVMATRTSRNTYTPCPEKMEPLYFCL